MTVASLVSCFKTILFLNKLIMALCCNGLYTVGYSGEYKNLFSFSFFYLLLFVMICFFIAHVLDFVFLNLFSVVIVY